MYGKQQQEKPLSVTDRQSNLRTNKQTNKQTELPISLLLYCPPSPPPPPFTPIRYFLYVRDFEIFPNVIFLCLIEIYEAIRKNFVCFHAFLESRATRNRNRKTPVQT